MLNPYLFYNGNCEAAFKFYEKALGAKIEMMLRNDQAPVEMPSPPERKKKIMHGQSPRSTARYSWPPTRLPEHFHKPQGFSVSLTRQ